MKKCITLIIMVIFFQSCTQKLKRHEAVEKNFEGAERRLLYFDFSDDNNIDAAVISKGSTALNKQVLPFRVKDFENDKNYSTAFVTEEQYTYFYIDAQQSNNHPLCQVSFTPDISFDEEPSENFFNNVVQNKGVYLKKSTTGNERFFLYSFDYQKKTFDELNFRDSFNIIEIRLPAKSVINEAPFASVKPVTDTVILSKHIKRYSGNYKSGVLTVQYTLPYSAKQKAAAKHMLDLAKNFSPFIVGLFIFFIQKKNKNKKVTSFILAFLALLLTILLIIGLFTTNNFIAHFLMDGDNNWDYVGIALGGILTILFVVLGIKKEDTPGT